MGFELDRQEVRQTVNDTLLRALPKLRGVPVIMLSAETGQGVDQLMPAIIRQYGLWNARIGTAKLNNWLSGVVERHPPPADKGRPVRLRYITQAKSRPPTFVTFRAAVMLYQRAISAIWLTACVRHLTLRACPCAFSCAKAKTLTKINNY